MTTIHFYPENIRKFIADLPRGNSCGRWVPENPDSSRRPESHAAGRNPNSAVAQFCREGRKGVEGNPIVLE
jgi:hypothetical protein